MPFIDIRIHPRVTTEQARHLSQVTTRAMAAVMGKRETVTAVCVQPATGAVWTIGGEPPSTPTAYVDIKITTGTNTSDQKAQLIDHLHRTLVETLGGLAEASYIVVHELPATDWGYAGRTQASRIQREVNRP